MNIFVDENIPAKTVKELIKLGHDVVDIRGSDKRGMAPQIKALLGIGVRIVTDS